MTPRVAAEVTGPALHMNGSSPQVQSGQAQNHPAMPALPRSALLDLAVPRIRAWASRVELETQCPSGRAAHFVVTLLSQLQEAWAYELGSERPLASELLARLQEVRITPIDRIRLADAGLMREHRAGEVAALIMPEITRDLMRLLETIPRGRRVQLASS